MTSAAITMTAPEAASPVQMYRATYSPDDNKLRLYAASRLDQETYKKVHDAGFRWAPKQALFVAPAWTPGREDVLLSLAGEIEDEDSTLAERQEARAERFTGYSGKRASESAQALDEVERLAAMIPPGQPILVGHHSERRARRDAQRIENGMKRAVMLFERAEYWEERARSALLHAKYKERPDVRWRRIKKIEADLRKAEKTIAQSQKYLTMWRAESLDLNMAKLISSHDHISACFPLDTYPRPAEKSQYEGSRSLWSALDDDIITTEQAREIAIRCHERQIQHQQRWVIRDNEGRVFARQGEVMNPLQYVPFNQTLYFINGDDPAQVAWMKRQTPPTLESKIILVQGSIPEMQKSLDSRVYFDQNGVLCQRLGIDQVPARVSAVPGDRFLKVEFIPAEEGRK